MLSSPDLKAASFKIFSKTTQPSITHSLTFGRGPYAAAQAQHGQPLGPGENHLSPLLSSHPERFWAGPDNASVMI
ncbi:hypothetical protein CRUP_010782 [Coryphaenoides rupestris]|nr:hypothetical protein CRUP_010782 [Coryphaenoides rupestris]